MKTFAEVTDWCAGAAEAFGDPSVTVCHLFFCWHDDLNAYRGQELACGMIGDELVLLCGPDFPPFAIPVSTGQMQVENDELTAYGAERITRDVWAITPSLNAVGIIHGFVVLHGVPDPAPWERRIILPGQMKRKAA